MALPGVTATKMFSPNWKRDPLLNLLEWKFQLKDRKNHSDRRDTTGEREGALRGIRLSVREVRKDRVVHLLNNHPEEGETGVKATRTEGITPPTPLHHNPHR